MAMSMDAYMSSDLSLPRTEMPGVQVDVGLVQVALQESVTWASVTLSRYLSTTLASLSCTWFRSASVANMFLKVMLTRME